MKLRRILLGTLFAALMLAASGVATPSTVAAQSVPSSAVDVWWPKNNASVSGTQPFKAMMPNIAVTKYQMFWQVDGGQLNSMYDSYADYPHKEAQVDVSGWSWRGEGPYQITFVAKNSRGMEIGKQTVTINLPKSAQPTPAPVVPVVIEPVIAPAPAPIAAPAPAPIVKTQPASEPVVTSPVSSSNNNPFAGAKLYVDANSNASRLAKEFASSRPEDAKLLSKIAGQSESVWLGDWNQNIYNDVKNITDKQTADGSMPVFIAYNMIYRDCGHYSAGGVSTPEQYRNWITKIADAIGNRKAAVILEPDALALTHCLNTEQLQTRYDLIKYAIATLKAKGNIAVYIDAAHPEWIGAQEMAGKLNNAGIAQADGFALNVSNFVALEKNISHGEQISKLTNGKHFIVDTARNGNGSNGEWCNPNGRALGKQPTTNTGNSLVDAFLWLKKPGESDGNCNGGPSAGVWWTDYALGLARRASY